MLMWILRQGGNCRQLNLLAWNSFINQLVHPVEGRGWGKMGISARCVFHFIRVHDNLVKDLSNIKSFKLVNCLGFTLQNNHRYNLGFNILLYCL